MKCEWISKLFGAVITIVLAVFVLEGCDSAKDRLAKAKEFERQENYQEARWEYDYIIVKYPKSKEAAEAEQRLSEVDKKLEQQSQKAKSTRPSSTTAPAASPTAGGASDKQPSTILKSNGEIVPVAISKEAFDRFTKLSVAKDTIGIRNMVLAGLVFSVDNGTRVVVIDHGFLKSEVRIMSGKYFGLAVWVASDFVKK